MEVVTLESERLILRKWKEDDIYDLFEYASVEGVGEMAGWPHHQTIDESKAIVQLFLNKDIWAIEHKSDHKVIGSIGLHDSWAAQDEIFKHLTSKEIGYVLSKDYWGQNLMPEAVKTMIQYCFETLKFDLITCCHFTHNMQSKRVIEKCGFTYYDQSTYEAKQLNQTFSDYRYLLKRH